MKAILLVTAFLLLLSCGKDSPETESMNEDSSEVQSSPQLISDDLCAASLNGDLDTVREAIEQGGLNEADPVGRTALMITSFNGHTEIVRFLGEQEGLIDETDSVGRTPLMFAASGPFFATVEYFLTEGANPDVTDNLEKWTPLMFAAAEGNREVIELLLEHGADVSITDKDGEKAVDFAIQNDHLDIVSILDQ